VKEDVHEKDSNIQGAITLWTDRQRWTIFKPIISSQMMHAGRERKDNGDECKLLGCESGDTFVFSGLLP